MFPIIASVLLILDYLLSRVEDLTFEALDLSAMIPLLACICLVYEWYHSNTKHSKLDFQKCLVFERIQSLNVSNFDFHCM